MSVADARAANISATNNASAIDVAMERMSSD